MQMGTWVNETVRQQHLAWALAQAKAQGLLLAGRVLFVGTRSSYGLAQLAEEYGQRQEYPTQGRPPEDVVLEPDLAFDDGVWPVVISRSGASSKAALTRDVARAHGVRAIAVTCHGD